MNYLKYIPAILFLIMTLSSCGNESNKVATEIENATQTIKNSKKVAESASGMQENIQLLRKMEHLTKEQWEAWLPETVLGMPSTTPQFNFLPGLGSCAANYKVGNKRIRVMVIDGAGEKGAGGVGPYRMSSKMDYDTEDKWGYTKSRMINGIKVKESYNKTGDSYSLSMFYNERFAVDVETHEIEQSELDQIVKGLNLNKLSN
ncbi:hypothetical protein [Marinirhabdus gelatinilytica]|uniref:Uncharacterized protein n=1 Tax=Marinirhabdus gelatinilytica TaxID=1703343 RepID=A0A370QF21_9FLAO|nr:hypothetical protein [Marinirhabdus gelatinilytica]RDK86968.1 hypothetical protein C8D94_102146 [Marinirhabdus gelatinilytica]